MLIRLYVMLPGLPKVHLHHHSTKRLDRHWHNMRLGHITGNYYVTVAIISYNSCTLMSCVA